MKARFIKNEFSHEQIEIIPNAHTFNSFDGRVTIYFRQRNNEFKLVESPYISVNCMLHKLTLAEAKEWSDILQAASMLAEGRTSPSWDDSLYQAYREYWISTHPQPTPAPADARAAVTTFAGSVDYGDSPETAQVGADGAFFF